MAGLSKSRILLNLQCPKRLWLEVNHPELAVVDEGAGARMSAGNEVGEIARSLYPDGLLIEPGSLAAALDETNAALAETPRPLFEATFEAGGVLIRADLLIPEESGYRMAEVKSSTGVKDYHLADAAIQTWVCKKNGLPLTKVEIAHIDTSFVYPGGGNYQGLLAHTEITSDIAPLVSEVPGWIEAAQFTLVGGMPEASIGERCEKPFPCPFTAQCHSPFDPNAFPLDILPYGGKVVDSLLIEGYRDLREIREDQLETPKHKRVWRVTVSGQTELDAAAGEKLSALGYPRYYLDFETIQFAVPRWAGTRPYAQIPFQWSCHIEQADGNLAHTEFLADGLDDPRRSFAETLIATLGSNGPIIVYNAGFERGRMQELAKDFPDLASALEAAILRIVDLLPIAREHYYHRDMRGSWSIKAVLPTIAPDLDYSSLAVAHGGMAQQAFLERLDPNTSHDRRQELTAGLLAYCARDTLAMVRVAHYFQQGN